MIEGIAKTIVTIIVFGLLGLLIYAISTDKTLQPGYADDQCKKHYGKEYSYVMGDRSPDLCVTKDGKVRYYELIK